MAGQGEQYLGDAMDDEVSREDELRSDYELEHLRRDAVQSRGEQGVDDEDEDEGLAGEEVAMVPLAAVLRRSGRLVASVEALRGEGADDGRVVLLLPAGLLVLSHDAARRSVHWVALQ